MEDGESNRIYIGTSRSLPSQDPKDKAETVGAAKRVRKRQVNRWFDAKRQPSSTSNKHKAATDSNSRVSQSRGPRKRSQVKKDTTMDEGHYHYLCVQPQPHYKVKIVKIVEDERSRDFGDVIIAPNVPS
jgi:hypothetical protein